MQDGGDQFRIRRQGDVFLGTGLDGADRGLAVVADAASDDGKGDAFAFQRGDQARDVGVHVDHDQVRTLSRAQLIKGPVDRFGLLDLGSLLHRDLACGADLPAERTDNQ